jgi:hypothetical protein
MPGRQVRFVQQEIGKSRGFVQQANLDQREQHHGSPSLRYYARNITTNPRRHKIRLRDERRTANGIVGSVSSVLQVGPFRKGNLEGSPNRPLSCCRVPISPIPHTVVRSSPPKPNAGRAQTNTSVREPYQAVWRRQRLTGLRSAGVAD